MRNHVLRLILGLLEVTLRAVLMLPDEYSEEASELSGMLAMTYLYVEKLIDK